MNLHSFFRTSIVVLVSVSFVFVVLQSVSAIAPLTLTVFHDTTPGGTITSSPAGISCDSDCSEVYTEGQVVILTAADSAGREFAAWSPGQFCAEPSNLTATCTVTIPADGLDMTALWAYDSYDFSVSKTGSGSGTVSGPGFSCGASCNFSVNYGDWATMTATPAAGSVFSGWQTAGTVCDSLGQQQNVVVTTPTCDVYGGGLTNPGYSAVARFDLAAEVDESGNEDEGSEEFDQNSEEAVENQNENATLPVPQAFLKDGSGDALFSLGDVPAVFSSGETVSIGGSTIPNGEIKLFIFSDPIEAETKADEFGEWSYAIEGLGPGEHRVETVVTDPDTEEVSPRAEILRFFIDNSSNARASQNLASTSGPSITESSGVSSLLLAAMAVVIGIAGWLINRYHRRAE